jgi:hypothetical protein
MTNENERPDDDEQEERMGQDEIRMAALGIVIQLPLYQEDAMAILDHARFVATDYLFKEGR